MFYSTYMASSAISLTFLRAEALSGTIGVYALVFMCPVGN